MLYKEGDASEFILNQLYLAASVFGWNHEAHKLPQRKCKNRDFESKFYLLFTKKYRLLTYLLTYLITYMLIYLLI